MEWCPVRLNPALGCKALHFLTRREPRHARKNDQIAPILSLGKAGNTSGAAYRSKTRRIGLVGGLYHADHPVIGLQRIIEHRQVARFKQIQWQSPPRQQKSISQGKDRNDLWQVSDTKMTRHPDLRENHGGQTAAAFQANRILVAETVKDREQLSFGCAIIPLTVPPKQLQQLINRTFGVV